MRVKARTFFFRLNLLVLKIFILVVRNFVRNRIFFSSPVGFGTRSQVIFCSSHILTGRLKLLDKWHP